VVASIFDAIMASADAPLREVFGKIYQLRWQGQSIDITATLQSHASIAETDRGNKSEAILTESWHGHNFIVEAADIVFDGVQVDPVAGMILAEPLDDGGYILYELAPPSDGRVFEPVDAEARLLFLFAVETGEESA